MPINGSFASMSKRGFQSQTAAPNPGATYYYFDALNTKGYNTSPGAAGTNSYGRLLNINYNMYWYGTGAGDTGSNRRPFVVKTDYTGAITEYKTWDIANYFTKGVCYDSSGNQHVLFTYAPGSTTNPVFRLLKFDSTGTLLLAKSFTFPGSSSIDAATFGMCIDSSDNLYVGTIYGVNLVATKIDCSTYTVQWCNGGMSMVSVGSQIPSTFKILIDSSNNVYLSGKYYGGSPTPFDFIAIMSLDSSGTLRWAKAYTNTYNSGTVDSAVDTSGNLYTRFGPAILKHDSSGTLAWSKTVSGAYISLNSLGNIVSTSVGGSTSYVNYAINSLGAGVSSTTWTISSGAISPINSSSDGSNFYVQSILSNGLGGTTYSVIKSTPNGTSLAGSNSLSFSQTLNNGTTNSWSTTISTTTGGVPTTSNVSYSVSTGTSITTFTLTVATISMTVGATVPVMYSHQLT